MAAKNLDMTKGNPAKLILQFAWPLMIGSIFQTLYNTVDSVVVGRFVGASALAAIGVTNSVTFMILSIGMGVMNAVSIVLSQYFGAHDENGMRKTSASTLYIAAALSLFMGLCGIFGARPVMRLLGTPADIMEQAVLYIQIVCGFCAAQTLYNGASSLLRALGDSQTPLYVLIFCSLLNVALDLLFVLSFHMDVAGVALATVLSQGISAAVSIAMLWKKYPQIRFHSSDLAPQWSLILRILRLGLTMALQSCILSLGMMVITGVVNRFGTSVVAAYTAGGRVMSIVTMLFSQLAFAFSVYVGQNFGARDFDRIRKGFRSAWLIVTAGTLLALLLGIFARKTLVALFVDPAELEIASMAHTLVLIEACFYPFLGWIWLYGSTLRGAGDVNWTLFSAMLELGVKIGGSILFAHLFGYKGIWWANPIGWAIGLIPYLFRYYGGGWKKLAPPPETQPAPQYNEADSAEAENA